MEDQETLRTAGSTAFAAYGSQSNWLHRIVETLAFPSPEELLVRRNVSFDLTIPYGLTLLRAAAGRPVVYVPLSFVRKWPPLIGLDIEGSDGRPAPFLTRQQNASMDFGLLLKAVEPLIAPEPVSLALGAELEEIVRADGPTKDPDVKPRGKPKKREVTPAERAYYGAVREIRAIRDIIRKTSPALPDLSVDDPFLVLAWSLASSTVLWVPIASSAGERHIVKVGYDIRRKFGLYLWHRAAYGWTGYRADFELPHVGSAGTYHLDIAAPSPLGVIGARFDLSTPRRTLDEPKDGVGPELPRQYPTLSGKEQARALNLDLKIDERPSGRHGTFYLAGDRNCDAVAWIKLLVDKDGYIRGACLASCVTTTILVLACVLDFGRAVRHSATVTVLLFLPALLSYIIVRTSEHAVAKQFLSGLRKLVTVTSLLPIAGVVGIVLSKSGTHAQPSGFLWALWITLIVISSLITLVFLASSYLPKSVITWPPLLTWFRIRRARAADGISEQANRLTQDASEATPDL